MEHVRQGDVMLVRAELPEKVKPLAGNIVAYGEVTGHAHRIEVDAGDVTLVEDEQGNMFAVVKGDATMRHEEHGPIKLTEGTYKVVRQREYAPERNRQVAD